MGLILFEWTPLFLLSFRIGFSARDERAFRSIGASKVPKNKVWFLNEKTKQRSLSLAHAIGTN